MKATRTAEVGVHTRVVTTLGFLVRVSLAHRAVAELTDLSFTSICLDPRIARALACPEPYPSVLSAQVNREHRRRPPMVVLSEPTNDHSCITRPDAHLSSPQAKILVQRAPVVNTPAVSRARSVTGGS